MKLSIVVAVLALAACEGKSTPTSKTPEPTPTPAAATCKQDSDCVISCESRDGCCHAPCCDSAMLESERTAIITYNQQHCPKNPQCPTVGGCPMEYDFKAVCKAGACVAEKSPHLVTMCTKTEDCTVVNMTPCDKCGCAQTPVAKSDEQRAEEYAASIKCSNEKDDRVCGECMPAHVECVNSQCVTK